MKITPVLIIGLDGQSPVQPLQASDLLPLAKDATVAALAQDATLQTVFTAVKALPAGHTQAIQLTVDLSVAHANLALALAPLTVAQRVRVKSLSAGAAATLKFGPAAAAPLDLAAGDDFPNLNLAALTLNNAAGGAGASLVLQIFGR